MKKNLFNLPYIGYDKAAEIQKYLGIKVRFDALIGEYGNPILAIRVKNTVTQYSADKQLYLQYHNVLNNIIAILGEGHVLQKIDILDKKTYEAENHEEYLQQKYSEHFQGRIYKTIDTVFTFTHMVNTNKKKKKYISTINNYRDLIERVEKISLLLSQNNFNPTYLLEADFEKYIYGILTMNFNSSHKYLDNIKSYDTHIKIGNKFVKTISFVDIENIELPSEIKPYTKIGGNNAIKNTAVDNFSFLNNLEAYSAIIYNQIVSIPIQTERLRFLQKKRNKHEGFQTEPHNRLCAEEIDILLTNVAADGQLIVDAQFMLVVCTKTQEELEQTNSLIEGQLFQKGIITSKSSFNQLELYRTALIGNAIELKDYDYFTTTSEASLCFFFKESFPISENSNFYLRFTDRQGVPIKIDTSDLPMTTNRINNRNKFVLGPSGSGKSFLMNNIVEQYLSYNYDVVIVDTGDSYSGLCDYQGGKYVQYTEKKPITMNPFNLQKEELNIEKIEFLVNLIFLIWQGADSSMTTIQKSILDNLLRAYYHQFFEKNTNWCNTKNNDELLLYLSKFNINSNDINQDIEITYNQENNYYSLLGISSKATDNEIKIAYRKKSLILHPDKNTDKKNYKIESWTKISDAYTTLKNPILKKEYDLKNIETTDFNLSTINNLDSKEYNLIYRKALVKKIQELNEMFEIKELSFNSFYEFAINFLPIYLNNENHRISENQFNQTTFKMVLADFYKGGIYDTTLNESADDSLFDEKFIVFEIDNVKDNPKLFPIVTLIIMDTFIQKMRMRKDRRKALIIEEAWKAIASKLMGGYILYLYKTVRKFWGEAVVVTQELDDIIGNAIVKDSIINNSDTFILLDQTKFIDNFNKIASLLSLNEVEQSKIFTINNLNNKFNRSRFKEFYIKRGATGEVYGNEVSLPQYLTYTTEKPEKVAIHYYVNQFGNFQKALDAFIKDINNLNDGLPNLVSLINLYEKPLDEKIINFYHNLKSSVQGADVFKNLKKNLEKEKITLTELINKNSYSYETL